MVVKIQQAAEDTERALLYNTNKMSGPEGILEGSDLEKYEEDHAQTGHVLEIVNVPETSNLRNEFSRLKMKNKRNAKGRPLEKPVFHMSVNPGETDRKLSEKEVVAFIKEVMERLGYKDNPYGIFKHNDIAREHYHVVATRIGQDGNKVKDSFENKRCNNIIESLAKKYGYTVGSDDGVTLDEEMERNEKGQNESRQEPLSPTDDKSTVKDAKAAKKGENRAKKEYVPPFNSESKTPTLEQYADAHEDAMQWSFSTPEQYAALMLWRYNIRATIYNESYYYAGVAKKGQSAPSSAGESEIGIDALKQVVVKCQECSGQSKSAMKYKKAQKERIDKLTKWTADQSNDWVEFRKLMERKGVYVVLSWSENGEPFGMTYLDRATKCAWKASETDVDLTWLKAKAEEKGWEISRHPRYEREPRKEFSRNLKPEEMKDAATRRQSTHAVRNSSSPSVLESLASKKGVGKTQRSNADAAKNKERLKKEDDDRNDIII